MINARIDKSIKQFDVEGTPADVVVEFGYMINQYCSAVKNAARRSCRPCERPLRPLLRRIARCGPWTRMWREFL